MLTRSSALFATTSILLTGCGLALGLGDFTEGEPSTTSTGSTGSTSATGTGGSSTTSTSTTTTSSAGGAGGSCMTGDTQPCYDFDPATMGKGNCKAGTQTCANGVWGMCMGEVGPATEDCATEGDENCDGAACGDVEWANSYGDSDNQFLLGLGVDSTGNIFLVGAFSGSITFGNTTLMSAGDRDVYVAKLGPDGTPLWAKSYGDALFQGGIAGAAVDSKGNVLFAGSYAGTIDFGAGVMSAVGMKQNMFVTEIDGTGKCVWSRTFSGAILNPQGVAFSKNDDAVIVGGFNGTQSFGGSSFTSSGADIFALKLLGPTGAHSWSKSFGETPAAMTDQIALGATVAPNGDVKIVGEYAGNLTFGPATLVSMGTTGDIFLGTLDGATGTGLGGKTFGDTAQQAASAIAINSNGEQFLFGTMYGTASFGAAPSDDVKTTGPNDKNPFLAALDAMGNGVFASTWGDANDQFGSSMVIDKQDNVVITAPFKGTINFGGNDLVNQGIEDAYVTKLKSGGNFLWNRSIGGGGDTSFMLVATDPKTNEVVIGVSFTADVKFDAKHDFPGHGATSDIAVAKYFP